MPRLTPEEKKRNRFERWLEKARESGTQFYMPKVSTTFQKMIRAEAGARDNREFVYVSQGEIGTREVYRGFVVCATCGIAWPWSSGGTAGQNRGGMQTGHFIASRRASILFEETNVAPQCAKCNIFESGNQKAFAIWMLHVHGQDEIDRLTRLKNESVKFDLEVLVQMRMGFDARLKAAVEKMK